MAEYARIYLTPARPVTYELPFTLLEYKRHGCCSFALLEDAKGRKLWRARSLTHSGELNYYGSAFGNIYQFINHVTREKAIKT